MSYLMICQISSPETVYNRRERARSPTVPSIRPAHPTSRLVHQNCYVKGSAMPTISPEELGFAPERLARIDAAMQRYVDQKKIAGIVTLVARRGQIAHHATYGMAD